MLKVKQVSEMTSLSPASIRRMYQAGTFPKPMQLSVGRYAWHDNDVKEWINKLEEVKSDKISH